MHATITIQMDNDAFAGNQAAELARILRNAAQDIEGGAVNERLFDANGNTVGKFIIHES